MEIGQELRTPKTAELPSKINLKIKKVLQVERGKIEKMACRSVLFVRFNHTLR